MYHRGGHWGLLLTFLLLDCGLDGFVSPIGGVHVRDTPTLRFGTLSRRSKGQVPLDGLPRGEIRFRGKVRDERTPPGCNGRSQGVYGRQGDAITLEELKVLRERPSGPSGVKDDVVRPIRGGGDDGVRSRMAPVSILPVACGAERESIIPSIC